MSRMNEHEIDLQTVVALGLCTREDVGELSFEELDELILKAENILKASE